ncbi:MAG: hypothetical protein AB1641_29960 [Thermodesulfobacteriota bacterium]
MFNFIIKVLAALFFAFAAADAFYKRVKIRREIEDEVINRITGEILRRRAFWDGLLMAILALLAFASIWFKVSFLGE